MTTMKKNLQQVQPFTAPSPPPFRRDIDIGCGFGILLLDSQSLCIIMTRIDLSPEMVDRDYIRSVPVVVGGGGED